MSGSFDSNDGAQFISLHQEPQESLAAQVWDTMKEHKIATTLGAGVLAGAALYFSRGEAAEDELAGITKFTKGMDQPGTVGDILKSSVADGRYGYEEINGVSVMMPKPARTGFDVFASSLKSGAFRFDQKLGAFMPRK
ncbi:MAG TPA: hypothetical protein V6C81_31575 [Planktothrix sp.]|jgi:hypothetical protein